MKEVQHKTVCLIGAGKVGSTLTYHLVQGKYRLKSLFDIDNDKANVLIKKIKQGTVFDKASEAVKGCNLILTATPDTEIPQIARSIIASVEPGSIIMHASGALPAAILNPDDRRDVHAVSLHPLFSFPELIKSPESLRGICFAIEGDVEGVKEAAAIAEILGGKYIIIETNKKVLYHTAAVFSANFTALMLWISQILLRSLDIEEDFIREGIGQLAGGVLENFRKDGAEKALTGPLVRGDAEVIEKHLATLKRNNPEFLETYGTLSLEIINMLRSQGNRKSETFDAIEKLIKEFSQK